MSATYSFAFTKLIVHDLEKQAAFYCETYGLHAVQRVRTEIGREAIDEIMLSSDPNASFGSLVLLKFLTRPTAQQGELILGFLTENLSALLDRVQAAGGSVHAAPREMPELNLRVAFVTDPEGHLAELVQMLG